MNPPRDYFEVGFLVAELQKFVVKEREHFNCDWVIILSRVNYESETAMILANRNIVNRNKVLHYILRLL
jgi:hypothetical protein